MLYCIELMFDWTVGWLLLLLLLGYGWVSIEYSDSEMSLMMAGGMYTAAAPPAAEVVLT